MHGKGTGLRTITRVPRAILTSVTLEGGDSVNSRCLLVVDADPDVHKLVTGILQREGRSIEDAYNSREALERLRTLHCDVVLAGQGRNGDDGLKLVRRVRAIQPDTRVIVTGESKPERVVDAIRQRAFGYVHTPLAEVPLIETVQQALECHQWQNDIRVTSARPEWVGLEVRCKIDAADRTTHFVRELHADIPTNIRDDFSSAFRELLMNAIEHGGKSDPNKRVRVSIVRTSKSIIVHMADPGPGFSMNLLPHAAINNPEDSPIAHVEVRLGEGRRPGGFGILMTRNLVDELIYNERGNAVVFVKYLS